MLFTSQKVGILPALLVLVLVQSGLSVPTNLRDELPRAVAKRQEITSEAPVTSSGPVATDVPVTSQVPTTTVPFPANNVTTSAGPTGTGDPIPDTPICSPAECPQACGENNSTNSSVAVCKRFLEPFTLNKRFFEIPSDDPGSFTLQLSKKRYADNLSPDPTKFVWHAYEPTKQYASAIVGLSGCTAVYITSPKGMFSAHLWEGDANTHIDLQRSNYEATLQKLKDEIAPHKDDLADGDAFVIIPTKPGRKGTRRYAHCGCDPCRCEGCEWARCHGAGVRAAELEDDPEVWGDGTGRGSGAV